MEKKNEFFSQDLTVKERNLYDRQFRLEGWSQKLVKNSRIFFLSNQAPMNTDDGNRGNSGATSDTDDAVWQRRHYGREKHRSGGQSPMEWLSRRISSDVYLTNSGCYTAKGPEDWLAVVN